MSKAFTSEETETEEDLPEEADILPAGQKNYMTPPGFARLQEELRVLTNVERPKVVEIVSWAAGNGDRSENGDYLYGKKRLREIDRRIRYLMKRLENTEVVDPRKQQALQQVFFGATVTYVHDDDRAVTVHLVGIDEIDTRKDEIDTDTSKQPVQKISWVSPVARALLKARVGDSVNIRTPKGPESVEILSIRYIL